MAPGGFGPSAGASGGSASTFPIAPSPGPGGPASTVIAEADAAEREGSVPDAISGGDELDLGAGAAGPAVLIVAGGAIAAAVAVATHRRRARSS